MQIKLNSSRDVDVSRLFVIRFNGLAVGMGIPPATTITQCEELKQAVQSTSPLSSV